MCAMGLLYYLDSSRASIPNSYQDLTSRPAFFNILIWPELKDLLKANVDNFAEFADAVGLIPIVSPP
jgi:hypothetical protein